MSNMLNGQKNYFKHWTHFKNTLSNITPPVLRGICRLAYFFKCTFFGQKRKIIQNFGKNIYEIIKASPLTPRHLFRPEVPPRPQQKNPFNPARPPQPGPSGPPPPPPPIGDIPPPPPTPPRPSNHLPPSPPPPPRVPPPPADAAEENSVALFAEINTKGVDITQGLRVFECFLFSCVLITRVLFYSGVCLSL